MSNQLQENLNLILEEKNTKLLPENLKAGITCLGVTGNLEEGVDTSDATASASDIAYGKSAYVNGEKVVGAVSELTSGASVISYVDKIYPSDTALQINGEKYTSNKLFRIGSYPSIRVDNDEIATAIDLTSDKIAKGYVVLGVTGEAETGSSEGGYDTSNATATADDIISGKTAYINGGLVTGTITDARNVSMMGSASASALTKSDTKITLVVPPMYPLPKVISADTYIAIDISNDILASVIGLTADKLVEGVTVLGITGTGGSQ